MGTQRHHQCDVRTLGGRIYERSEWRAGSTPNSLTADGYSANNRPNIVPGVGCNSGESGKQILNPVAFTFVGYVIGTVGDAPIELKAKQRERTAAPAQQSP